MTTTSARRRPARRRQAATHIGQRALFPEQGTDHFSDRPYQIEGVHAVVAGLRDGGRGQLRAACGTGKTSMALWSAERLAPPGGLVAVAVPTVGLVAQTLREWASRHGDLDAIAVCGDDTVADEGTTQREPDSFGGVEDILEPVTTDPDVVAAWLRRRPGRALRLIVGTHYSCHVLGEGLQKANVAADLLVVDEAHRTAGDADKHAALLHDDEVVPARRRLYMTATPRIFVSDAASDVAANGMDDHDVFGPVLFHYPFSEAIADGWLDDYQVAVIAVTREQAMVAMRDITARPRRDSTPRPTMRTAVVQAAVARAAAEFDLRRVIAFCPRVNDAQWFAETFPHTIAALPEHLRPPRPLTSGHVNGGMSHAQRQQVMQHLIEPPDCGWSVVSNARCLSEGIDVPAVDAVAFTAPKKSVTEIVQAVGRALRRSADGSGVATIIVPVLLSNDDHDADELHAGDFEILWEVVRALRAHDDTFATALDNARATGTRPKTVLDRFTFMLPENLSIPNYLEHLTVRLVQAGTSQWWASYGALAAHHREFGNIDIRYDHVTASGVRLGRWMANTRYLYNKGRLTPDRVEALDRLGFVARVDPWKRKLAILARTRGPDGEVDRGAASYAYATNILRELRIDYEAGRMSAEHVADLDAVFPDWEVLTASTRQRLAAARRYFHENGHLLPPQGTRDESGASLHAWLSRQRMARQAGRLTARFIAKLDTIGMVWNVKQAFWECGFAALAEFHNCYGHFRVPTTLSYPDPRGERRPLQSFVQTQRAEYRSGRLASERTAALAELGFSWEPEPVRWSRNLAALKAFRAKNGHLLPPNTFHQDGVDVGSVVFSARRQRADGSLPADYVAGLDALGMVWDVKEAAWQDMIAFLRAYRDQHGDISVPQTLKAPLRLTEEGHVAREGGVHVAHWIRRQRARRRAGTLTATQIADLDALGMQWEERPQDLAKWQRMFRLAQEYYARNGHLLVTYQDSRNSPEYLALYTWLARVRAAYRQGGVPADRMAELDAIGMQWVVAGARNTAWQAKFDEVTAYKSEHGSLPKQTKSCSKHALSLAKWLQNQRAQYSQGKLPPDRANKLLSIGFRLTG